MERIGVLLLIIASLQGAVLSVKVEVFPTEAVVSVGQNVSMLCRAAVPIQYCRIVIPGLVAPLNLKEGRAPTPPSNAVYLGEGLAKGHCGVSIPQVEDKYNGIFKCTFGTENEAHESEGTMSVVVARAPTAVPTLVASRPRDPQDTYQEHERFQATCEVPEARPAANITWFMGDDIVTEGVSPPEIFENSVDKLYRVRQNLTRDLRWSDNGKDLRCVASHPVLADDPARTTARKKISVKFGPQPANGDLEQFGFIEGEEGEVRIRIKANPKPSFVWTVGREDIYEGSTSPDAERHFEVAYTEPKGNGEWETKLTIRPVTKEDVEREYRVQATNTIGQQDYTIRISTSSQPRAMAEMGAGAIVGIVIAVLLVVLIIFIVVFARATGRWCFAGGASHRTGETGGGPEDPGKTEEAKRLTPKSRISTSVNSEQLLGQSSDTESADQGPGQKKNILKKKVKIPLTNMFKKAKDKVAGDTEVLKTAVVIDDKDAEKAAQQVAQDGEQGKECVYAELTHAQAAERGRPVVVRPEDDKTEYAEIVHTKDEKKADK